MRKALIYLFLLAFSLIASAQDKPQQVDSLTVPDGTVIPMRGAFLSQCQARDSVLIGDQVIYGVELRLVERGTQLSFPQWQNDPKGGVTALSQWMVDTVKVTKQKNERPDLLDIKAGLVLTSFDEGQYDLPQIVVQRKSLEGVVDTLLFEPVKLQVKTMPLDTATFVPHDIKGQIRYPVTVTEVAPWFVGAQCGIVLIILAVCLYMIYRRKDQVRVKSLEPAHVVALRELDKFRGKTMWAPEKQKAFYSGITDTLREYISRRYDIGAMEMTTAEIFKEMKSTDAPEELLNQMRDLFERADFVKFAKWVASDEDNATALPVAVRFVTQTYQTEIETAEKSE